LCSDWRLPDKFRSWYRNARVARPTRSWGKKAVAPNDLLCPDASRPILVRCLTSVSQELYTYDESKIGKRRASKMERVDVSRASANEIAESRANEGVECKVACAVKRVTGTVAAAP